MKILSIITRSAALILLLASPARAEAPSPVADILLAGDVLTVGDVFPGVAAADHVLAPAPAPGTQMILSTSDLQRISDAFALGWQAASPRTQAVVRRNGSVIAHDEIVAAISDALRPALSDTRFRFEPVDNSLTLTTTSDAAVRVAALDFDPKSGRVAATVKAGDVSKTVNGRVRMTTAIPVVKTALRQGDVIGADDITTLDMPSERITSNMIVDAEKLIGMTPRRGIAALRPLMAADVMAPVAIKKGDVVTLTLNHGVMSLTATGRALEAGAIGDIVRIVNSASNKIIEGEVTAPQTVAVRFAG